MGFARCMITHSRQDFLIGNAIVPLCDKGPQDGMDKDGLRLFDIRERDAQLFDTSTKSLVEYLRAQSWSRPARAALSSSTP